MDLHILFAYGMAMNLNTFGFLETVFHCSNLGPRLNEFSFYVMGKKYMLSLLSDIFVLCNCVESSKIASYFELF